MLNKSPLVSVIIPTYYRNQKLKRAIDSVQTLNYDNLEIIVIDDSGEGHARETVMEYNEIIYIESDSNQGANQARSIGIKQSSGDYIQLLDDDDVLKPSKITKQIEVLNNNENCSVAYCGQVFKSRTVSLPREEGRGNVLHLVLAGELKECVTSTLLIESQLAHRITPLPDSPGADDMYIKIEIAKHSQFEFVNEALIIRGDSGDARGVGENALKGMEELLIEYQDLYQSAPKQVKQTFLANLYHRKARYRITERAYSIHAIYLFLLAVYYYPGIHVTYTGRLFGSVFGQFGVAQVETIFKRLAS